MAVRPTERTEGKWLYDYTDAYGRRKWGTAESQDLALTIQSQRNTEWRLIKSGVMSPEQVSQGRTAVKPIERHIIEYEEHLRGKGVSPRYLAETVKALRRVLAELKVGAAEEIAADKVEALMNRRVEAGMGARMRNFYVKLLKAFLQLLEDRGAITKNNLRRLKAVNEGVDQRNVSRPMTHGEFTALLASLERTKGNNGLSTAEDRRREARRLYYLFGARAGMRWAETARLQYRDVDAEAWWLRLVARNTKGKRGESLPIPSDLAEALGAWMAAHPDAAPNDLIFPDGVPRLRTWKRDLVRAGIIQIEKSESPTKKARGVKKLPVAKKHAFSKTSELVGYEDESGGKLHRKCLRLTFGTWLYEAGVDVREAQRLMRHQDVNLTSKIYTRPRMENLQAAAEKASNARKSVNPPRLNSAG